MDRPERLVSHSEFRAYRRCRRRWLVHYVMKRGFAPREPGALDLGILTHLGLDVITSGGELEDARLLIREKAAEQAEASETPELWPEAASDAQNYVTGFVEWLAHTGADQRYVTFASEEELSMPLVTSLATGRKWTLIGKLDRRMYDRATERLTYMDYKTCATFESVMQAAYRSEQFPTYEALLRHTYPDQRTTSGVWRMLRKVKRARDGDGDFFRDYQVSINDQHINAVLRRFTIMALEMDVIETVYADTGDDTVAYPNVLQSCEWECPIKHECPMFDDGSRIGNLLSSHMVSINPYERYGELKGEEL